MVKSHACMFVRRWNVLILVMARVIAGE